MFKVTFFEPKTLGWWKTQINKIDFDPPYQRRGKLWSKSDKIYLIDSILNDYDIPKIYIADFTFGSSNLNKKKLSYAIIDGKQRFEAIFDFFKDEIVLNDSFVYLDDKKLNLSGLGYSDLRKNYPEVADKFDNYGLTVMRVISDNEEQISELFVRLNRNKPLTGAEIRNAMHGPAPALIREIVKHEFFSTYTNFNASRGQDLNTAAKLLIFEYYNTLRETKKSNLDRFVDNISSKNDGAVELAARRVIDNLDRMSGIFLPKDIVLNTAGIIPVYYWFIHSLGNVFDSKVREFLVLFNKQRQINRKRENDDSYNKKLDQQLLDFDRYNRSTNDQKSHEERVKILLNRFNK